MKLFPPKRSVRPGTVGTLIRFRHDRKAAATFFTVLLLAVAGLTSVHLRSARAQSSKLRYQQDIAKIFSNHEDVKLDARAISDQVRQFGHLSVRTATRDFELTPNDLRSPKYRAEETVGGVEHEIGLNTDKDSAFHPPSTRSCLAEVNR